MVYVVMVYVVMAYVVMAYVVMAYVVMDYVVMAYVAMAYVVMAYVVMAYAVIVYVVMAYVVMAYKAMAYIVMAYVFMACKAVAYVVMAYHCINALLRNLTAVEFYPKQARAIPTWVPFSLLKKQVFTAPSTKLVGPQTNGDLQHSLAAVQSDLTAITIREVGRGSPYGP